MTDKILFEHVTKTFKVRDTEKGKGAVKDFTR